VLLHGWPSPSGPKVRLSLPGVLASAGHPSGVLVVQLWSPADRLGDVFEAGIILRARSRRSNPQQSGPPKKVHSYHREETISMNWSSPLIFQVYFSNTKLAANSNYNSRTHLSLATAFYTLYYRAMPQHYATIYNALRQQKMMVHVYTANLLFDCCLWSMRSARSAGFLSVKYSNQWLPGSVTCFVMDASDCLTDLKPEHILVDPAST
jgi:hypothetical protein